MFITSKPGLINQLSAVVAGILELAGPLHTTVKLAQGTFNPTPDSVPGDFTEADFTGYAAKTVTSWTTPELDPGPAAKTLGGNLLHWAPSGTTVTNICTGYWIEDANGDYLGGEQFPAPIPMANTTDAITLIPQWQVAAATWSGLLIP